MLQAYHPFHQASLPIHQASDLASLPCLLAYHQAFQAVPFRASSLADQGILPSHQASSRASVQASLPSLLAFLACLPSLPSLPCFLACHQAYQDPFRASSLADQGILPSHQASHQACLPCLPCLLAYHQAHQDPFRASSLADQGILPSQQASHQASSRASFPAAAAQDSLPSPPLPASSPVVPDSLPSHRTDRSAPF